MSYRDRVLTLLTDADPHAAERYSLCGEDGHGRYSECSSHPIGSTDAHPHQYVPFSCMLRICPRCARRLSTDLKRKYNAIVDHVLDEQGWKVQRGWRIRHVTLTARYELSRNAGGRVRDLLDAARDTFKATWGQSEGSGAVASIEVGERGHKWHVHMVVWGPFVSHAELKAVWKRLTGHEVVWLQECGATVGKARGVVSEVLKYAVKFTGLDPEMLVELHLALKGRRRVRSWGSFYASGVEVEEEIEVCEVCGSRMRLVPEWAVEARLRWAAAGGSVFTRYSANKSPPRDPPREPLRAPRRLAGGVLCSHTPPRAWAEYSEARDVL